MNDETTNPGTELVVADKNVGNPNKWKIGLDVVKRATESMPEDQRDAMVWLCTFAISSNASPNELAARILKPNGDSYSWPSLYAALTGRRAEENVGVEKLVEAINRFRKRQEETAARMSTAFIETPMTRRIFQICRRAFTRKRLAFIYGPSQIGKTAALSEYQRRHNHGETRLIRMPTGGSLTGFQTEMATAFGIPTNQRADELSRRLMDCFDDRTLLIVDEAHQPLLRRGGVRTFEWLRELYDRRGCGMVLCGTEVLATSLRTNPVLGQLYRRRSPGAVINLPAIPPSADMDSFAAAFGLGPAPDRRIGLDYGFQDPVTGEERRATSYVNPLEMQAKIVTAQGLGSWMKLLEDARDDAAEEKTKISWGRVFRTYCMAEALETYATV